MGLEFLRTTGGAAARGKESSSGESDSFVFNKPALDFQLDFIVFHIFIPGESSESVGGDGSVAGNDNPQGVFAAGGSDRYARRADLFGDLSVGEGFPVGNVDDGGSHFLLVKSGRLEEMLPEVIEAMWGIPQVGAELAVQFDSQLVLREEGGCWRFHKVFDVENFLVITQRLQTPKRGIAGIGKFHVKFVGRGHCLLYTIGHASNSQKDPKIAPDFARQGSGDLNHRAKLYHFLPKTIIPKIFPPIS